MPYPNWGSSAANGAGWLYNPNARGLWHNRPPQDSEAIKTGLLYPYSSALGTFSCPMDKPQGEDVQARKNNGFQTLSGYIMNGSLCIFGRLSGKRPEHYQARGFGRGECADVGRLTSVSRSISMMPPVFRWRVSRCGMLAKEPSCLSIPGKPTLR